MAKQRVCWNVNVEVDVPPGRQASAEALVQGLKPWGRPALARAARLTADLTRQLRFVDEELRDPAGGPPPPGDQYLVLEPRRGQGGGFFR
jgi:hypothetical protein